MLMEHFKIFILKFLSSFFLSLLFTPPHNIVLTSPGLTTQIPVEQMPVEGATDCGSEQQTDAQGRASLNVWLAQCQDHRQRQNRTEHKQRTHAQSQDRN